MRSCSWRARTHQSARERARALLCRESCAISRFRLFFAELRFRWPRGSDLQRIPYGETISYEQQAREIGRTGAQRAIGRANGDNRIAIVIPCHRVVKQNGELCGYGGGLWRKKFLLDLERGKTGGVIDKEATTRHTKYTE